MTTPGPYQPNQPYQQPPVVAGQTYGQPPAPAWTPPPPVPPKRKSKAPLWASLVGLVLFLCAVGGVVAVLADGDKPTASATGGATTAAADAKAGQKAPTAKDVKLTAKVTEQKCYGSGIGCAVTWHPEVTYTGPEVASGTVWKISYTVTGLESGTSKGTIVMGGTTAAKQSDKRGRTADKDTKIVLKVTGIEAG